MQLTLGPMALAYRLDAISQGPKKTTFPRLRLSWSVMVQDWMSCRWTGVAGCGAGCHPGSLIVMTSVYDNHCL